MDLCFNGGHNSSLINSIFRGSTWQICPRKELPKQRTQALETRVLIKSWVLKTRDASFIHTFKTRQLTKLLEILCYLERVFFILSLNLSLSLKLPSHCLSLSQTQISDVILSSLLSMWRWGNQFGTAAKTQLTQPWGGRSDENPPTPRVEDTNQIMPLHGFHFFSLLLGCGIDLILVG